MTGKPNKPLSSASGTDGLALILCSEATFPLRRSVFLDDADTGSGAVPRGVVIA